MIEGDVVAAVTSSSGVVERRPVACRLPASSPPASSQLERRRAPHTRPRPPRRAHPPRDVGSRDATAAGEGGRAWPPASRCAAPERLARTRGAGDRTSGERVGPSPLDSFGRRSQMSASLQGRTSLRVYLLLLLLGRTGTACAWTSMLSRRRRRRRGRRRRPPTRHESHLVRPAGPTNPREGTTIRRQQQRFATPRRPSRDARSTSSARPTIRCRPPFLALGSSLLLLAAVRPPRSHQNSRRPRHSPRST